MAMLSCCSMKLRAVQISALLRASPWLRLMEALLGWRL